VAAIVGCSERGIETRLTRARVRLRSSLGSLWEEILGEVRTR
jgi:DNA-directed RNA polymerase specialized sigma24 family protein